MTRPEDVASALVALTTPGTHWMTGNVIGVDGGEVMGNRVGRRLDLTRSVGSRVAADRTSRRPTRTTVNPAVRAEPSGIGTSGARDPLAREVKLLGALLGQVIAEQEGEDAAAPRRARPAPDDRHPRTGTVARPATRAVRASSRRST